MSRNAAAYLRSPGAVSSIVRPWRPPAPAPGPLASTSRAAALHQHAHHAAYPASAAASQPSAANAFDPTFFPSGVGGDAAVDALPFASSSSSQSSSSSAHGPVPRAFTSLVGAGALPVDPVPPTASTSGAKPYPLAPTSALTDLSARSLPLFFVGRSSVRSAARVTTPPVSRPSYVFSPGAAGLPKQRARRGLEAPTPPSTWDSALVRAGTIGGERWVGHRDADDLSVQVGEDAFFLRTVRLLSS